MARTALYDDTKRRKALRKHEGLALVTDAHGVSTLTIPASVELDELVQAVERFASQRGRGVARNQKSENASGVKTFTQRETALVAVVACLSGMTVKPTAKRTKRADKVEGAATTA